MARPREFDTETALRKAIVVFWERGFDGASLTELADAMGIVRPSLQAAFGSKEGLYIQALDLYARDAMGFVVEALRAPTAAEVANKYLGGFCDMLADAEAPAGCFMIKAISASSGASEAARRECFARVRGYETLLEQRFRQAISDGDIDAKADPRALAETVVTITHGLAVRADMGASRAELHRVAKASAKGLF